MPADDQPSTLGRRPGVRGKGGGPRTGANPAQDIEGVQSVGRGRSGRLVGLLEGEEDLLAVYVDIAGSSDAQPDLVAPNLEDRHDDVVSNHDALVGVSGEHEHLGGSLRGWPPEEYPGWGAGLPRGTGERAVGETSRGPTAAPTQS